MKAHAHVEIVAPNIMALLKARESGKADLDAKANGLKAYKKSTDSVAITNGAVSSRRIVLRALLIALQSRGSTYLDFFTIFGWPIILGNWLTALLKSRGLLISHVRGMLYQKA
jgi:hypothetical protein